MVSIIPGIDIAEPERPNQQRILGAAEALAGFLLQCRHVGLDIVHQAVRQMVRLEIGQAGFGGHGKAGRHIQADLRHLAQAGALPAQQDLVLAIALFECVDIFIGVHDDASSN
jgi:hypothetical protein